MTEIQQNVDLLEYQGKEIYLVGTAHVSQESADLAIDIIKRVQPESVAVELCESRYKSLQDPERWKNTDIIAVIKQGKGYVLLSQLILASFQKKLGKNLNIKPGAEMMASVNIAQEQKAAIILADRDITTTLKRTWSGLSFLSVIKVLSAMVTGLFANEEIKSEDIEKLKSADALNDLMKEFSERFPDVKRSLIEERDMFLAEKIRTAPGNKIVAVVGAGHVPGIKAWLNKDIDIERISKLPEKKITSKIMPWILPSLVVLLIVAGFFTSGSGTSLEMIKSWAIINAVMAGFGAAVALAHPLTVLGAAISAPYTSLHPLIASGMVAAVIEAYIKKPRVADLENIAEDLSTFKGWYRNRVSRILVVMVTTNLFGSIGTLLATAVVGSML